MSALTDWIQTTTNVVTLAVAILGLRESRLQRRASAPLLDRMTYRAPEIDPTSRTQPPVISPWVGAPTYGVPGTVPPIGNEPAAADSGTGWRTQNFMALGAIVGLGYIGVANATLTTRTQWMIAGFVTLAITTVLLVYARRAPLSQTRHLAAVLGSLGAISIGSMIQPFLPPVPPMEGIINSAVLMLLAVIWLVVDRQR